MQDPTPANQIEGPPSPDLSITALGLSTRAKNVLLGAGISTVGKALAALEEGGETLTGLKGFGSRSLTDLKKRLQEQGFSLPAPPVPDEAVPPLKALETALEQEIRELEAVEMEMTGADLAAEVVLEEKKEEAPEIAPAAAVVAAPVEEIPQTTVAAATPASQAETLWETPTLGQRISATLVQARDQFRVGVWLYGLIGLLIIIALFLPPVSLLNRLGITGYTPLDAEDSSASHPDGITLSVSTETFADQLRVRMNAVPRLEFLEGSAGGKLREAVETLPTHLDVKSPLYQIQVRGESSQAVTIDVVIPNDAEPWETLDLYTWNGEEWRWVGGELHTEVAEHEFIRAHVNGSDVPTTLVVVQAGSPPPAVSTSLEPDDNPLDAAAGMLDEVNPVGLLLGTDGGFVGVPALPPTEGATYTILPTLRNWAPDASVNQGLLSDLLAIPEIQETHISNIVQLCTANGFAGVGVDYRGVGPGEREAYSAFIEALATELHAEGLRLSLVVEPPTPTDGGWDTGGYDWMKLGAAADVVAVPFPADPAAYVAGGQAQRLLDWATAQVDRYKLRMLVSSLSAEQSGEGVETISLQQALAPFGNIVPLADVTRVEPGSQVEFGLSGQVRSITPQETAGTYRLEYEADDGETRTVWLGTATNLATKLSWAEKYHLGGVVVADLLDPGNGPGIVDAVTGYRAATGSPVRAGKGIEVLWTVANAAATIDQQTATLTEPGYTWTVLAAAGDYTVEATIGGFDHGSVPVVVATPEPALTEEITTTRGITPTGGITATEPTAVTGVSLVTEECLGASYVADVTIPDNTRLEKGEEFVKTWSVRNSGTCAWPEDTVLVRVNSQLGGPESVPVGAVAAGETVEVSIDLVAPDQDGVFDGKWVLRTGDTDVPGSGLTAVIQAGEGASAGPAAAPAPVSGGSFQLGGHILHYGYASQMHHAGMNWVKVQVRYPQDASGLIAEAHANGFNILLGALGGPQDVTHAGFVNDYANWFASLASAGANAIEIWNEPNIEREWQIGHIDPTAYTQLLCTSYRAIKGANSDTLVVSGALAPTWHNPPHHWSDEAFLQGMAAAGAASCIDYVGAHYNSGIVPPSQRSGSPQGEHYSWYFWPMVDLYYGAFGGARQVIFTEMGYLSSEGYCQLPDNFMWAVNTTAAQQAQWLAEAISQAANSGKVRLIIVWNVGFNRYDCGPGNGDPQAGYSIIRPGGSCPACDSLHNILGAR
ncbi:MAG: NBR1-Ig-like domain-containing protein [Chloroflexota bacterium]|nr:NBR1-Ig-like domain-containing protein [Chloroflexota bacterium]